MSMVFEEVFLVLQDHADSLVTGWVTRAEAIADQNAFFKNKCSDRKGQLKIDGCNLHTSGTPLWNRRRTDHHKKPRVPSSRWQTESIKGVKEDKSNCHTRV